jgi:hypothetical protein
MTLGEPCCHGISTTHLVADKFNNRFFVPQNDKNSSSIKQKPSHLRRLLFYHKSEIKIPKSEILLFFNKTFPGNGIFNFGFQFFL